MTRAELIETICTYRPDFTLEELEASETPRLEYLLRLSEMCSEIEGQNVTEDSSTRSPRRGDEPPELTEDDEEILDRVWAQIAEGKQSDG